jgi:periplasmic protein TonB
MQNRTQRAPESAREETALGRCLVGGNTATESRERRKAFGLSFAIETAVLALLVVSPLLTSVAQPQLHPLPPMPILLGIWPARHANQPASPRVSNSDHQLVVHVSQTVFPAPRSKVREDAEQSAGVVLDLPGESMSGAILIPWIAGPPPRVDPPQIDRRTTPEKQIVKVSEGVEQAQLVTRIEPQYPVLAKETRTQGTVFLRAIISREGRITSLEVSSGHPLLVRAALEAVRQWRYRPTLLNGEPVEVETSITVIFRLGS